MSSLIFDYEVLGIGWEVIVQTLIGLCNVALDKDVCAGAIHNYAVLFSSFELNASVENYSFFKANFT